MKINKADLEGAIAIGWRSSKNKRKDMDMDLVEAIYEQVKDLLETIPVEKCIECKHLSNPDKVYPPRLCKKHTIPVESKEEGIFYICGLCGEKFTSKFITKPLKQPKTKQGCEKCTHKGKNKDGSSFCPDCYWGKTKEVKQDKPVKKELVSSCCGAKTTFIGSVYAGYEECSKCGKKCRLVLSPPTQTTKPIENDGSIDPSCERNLREPKHLDRLVVPSKLSQDTWQGEIVDKISE